MLLVDLLAIVNLLLIALSYQIYSMQLSCTHPIFHACSFYHVIQSFAYYNERFVGKHTLCMGSDQILLCSCKLITFISYLLEIQSSYMYIILCLYPRPTCKSLMVCCSKQVFDNALLARLGWKQQK